MRIVKSNFLLKALYYAGINHTTPINLSYLWNFGSLAMLCLVIQIVTGILLAMHYAADINLAFASVEHIMRDVNNGWLIRYMHANGASMFFIVVYAHMFRGIYYTSYIEPRQLVWVVGVAILLLMIITAFMGYVLPWGQMSFWGATVITNLFSAVPYIGKDIVFWLWGGYSIDNATLTRFYALHYLMPFVIAGAVILHIIFLHNAGSNNPLGIPFTLDSTPFSPYYIIKDVYGVVLFGIFFGVFLFFLPNTLGHPDNYIMANPLVTPAHIVPEWYFLPFYAILRAVPDKLFGVVAMVSAILILAALPFYVRTEVRTLKFRPLSKLFFWFLVFDCFLLGWVGGKPAKYPYVQVGQFLSVFYFVYFIVLLPSLERLETFFWSNQDYLNKFEK
jgi:quinol-cytochrome oxidoreductase complex cytochrome b subunit